MSTLTGQQILEQQNWRYAVKKFDPAKKITPKDWQALEDTLVLSPSSYGLQPWKMIVVQNPEIRKKLTPLSWGQTQVEDSSHYVVFASKLDLDRAYVENFIQRTADVRGISKDVLKGYQEMMIGDLVAGPRHAHIADWAARQAYIALGNLMTSAAIMGIDTCPMEGIEPPQYDEVLGLKGSGYATVVACAVGYRHTEDKYAAAKKVRFEKKDVLTTL